MCPRALRKLLFARQLEQHRRRAVYVYERSKQFLLQHKLPLGPCCVDVLRRQTARADGSLSLTRPMPDARARAALASPPLSPTSTQRAGPSPPPLRPPYPSPHTSPHLAKCDQAASGWQVLRGDLEPQVGIRQPQQARDTVAARMRKCIDLVGSARSCFCGHECSPGAIVQWHHAERLLGCISQGHTLS